MRDEIKEKRKMSQTFEERIRAKIESIKNPKKNQGSGENPGFRSKWKPKLESQNDVRLFGYPLNDKEEPFLELWFHYGLGFSFLCPAKMKNAKCPACDFSDQLFKKAKEGYGTEEGKQEWRLAKDIGAKQRFVAAMVDRTDPELTPKYWEFNEKIYLDLLQKLVDRDYKSYLDVLKGFDMTVTSQKIKDKKYADISFQFRPVQCRLADTDKKIKEIMDGLPKIETVYEMLTEEQIKQRLVEFSAKNEFPPKDAETTPKTDPELGNYLGDKKDLDVDSAFEKALDD